MGAREEKKQIVKEITEKFEQAKAVVLTDFRGLDVADITELRRRLTEAEVEYKVVKNTLTRRAVDSLGLNDLDEYLVGPTALAFGYDDPVTPAKVLTAFAKEHPELEIKAGLVEGAMATTEKISQLAELPSREVLLAQVLAGMQSPMSGLANVLGGTMRKLVYALDAIRGQKAS